METLSSLRRVPRRPALCFLCALLMFLACAFYTLLLESKSSAAPTFVSINEYEDEIYSKPSGRYVDGNKELQRSETSDSKPPIVLQGLPPAEASALKLSHILLNISGNVKQRKNNSVQVTTKYIYLANASTSSTTQSSIASVSNIKVTSTVAPLDSCHDPKLILLWTPFFDYWDYLPKEHFSRCSSCKNCKVTTDRTKLPESDAVIFHARDMSVTDMPSVRYPHQRWVFYCLESPPYSDFPGLQHTQNMFNWTMTYRADSDIPAPYGYVSRIRPPQKLDLQTLEWAWSNKSRSIVWMSSHCPTHGGRDLFAKELRRHIDIDIYGSCGTSVCPPGETDKCLQEFAQKYKFFLAFENSICKDYITEKFFRTLKYNIIPVVFGGADYSKFSPPGSYIDAHSFKSPKHLAFFLTGVGRNFKLYSSFFKWRKDYAIHLSNNKECKLCSMLHNKDLKPSSHENLREWWVNGSKCKIWEKKR